MTQFVILFTMFLAHGKPEKIWFYGKPAYSMTSHEACHAAADKIVQQVFAKAKRRRIKAMATTYCHDVRADQA